MPRDIVNTTMIDRRYTQDIYRKRERCQTRRRNVKLPPVNTGGIRARVVMASITVRAHARVSAGEKKKKTSLVLSRRSMQNTVGRRLRKHTVEPAALNATSAIEQGSRVCVRACDRDWVGWKTHGRRASGS